MFKASYGKTGVDVKKKGTGFLKIRKEGATKKASGMDTSTLKKEQEQLINETDIEKFTILEL